ncbi:MAG: DMT family transporter [Sutterella sp.]|nr:DMT family transporter [Sutterella sp.]
MGMNARMTGALCGIAAAVCYGTNPLGALPLYAEGVNSATVLFYRFSLAALILGLVMLARGTSFALTKKAFAVTAVLGVIFGFSALTLFLSFHLMDAGIASTILFTYPVFVALIMAVFFREKPNAATVISLALALAGVGLLYRGGDGAALNLNGMLLVLLSSLLYAGYIVIVNRASPGLSAVKLTFFVLIFCSLTMAGCRSMTAARLRFCRPRRPGSSRVFSPACRRCSLWGLWPWPSGKSARRRPPSWVRSNRSRPSSSA